MTERFSVIRKTMVLDAFGKPEARFVAEIFERRLVSIAIGQFHYEQTARAWAEGSNAPIREPKPEEG